MTDNIEDVADIGVTAAEDILDFSVNAVYLIGSDEEELKPVAHTEKVASVLGDVQSLPVDDSVAGRVYRRGESTAIDDVQQDSDVYNPESDLRAHMYLPLADHGVLIAGSEEKGVFDNHDIALAEILAGNLTAALDRIERDQAVRKQEQKLSLFFEDSPIGAVQWDEDFNFDRLNGRAEEILGYNEEN
jgi:PAS domain-containing protein